MNLMVIDNTNSINNTNTNSNHIHIDYHNDKQIIILIAMS